MTVLQLRGPMAFRVLQWCLPMLASLKEDKLLYPDDHLTWCSKVDSGPRRFQGLVTESGEGARPGGTIERSNVCGVRIEDVGGVLYSEVQCPEGGLGLDSPCTERSNALSGARVWAGSGPCTVHHG